MLLNDNVMNNVKYEVVYKDGTFWIARNGKILEVVGSFIDPLTPEVIIKEIEDEI